MTRFNYFVSVAGAAAAYHYGLPAVCYAYGFSTDACSACT